MKNIILTVLMCLSLNLNADIYSKNGHSKILILNEYTDCEEYISFKFCKAGAECISIGNKEYYSRSELEDIRFHEKMHIAYSSITNLGIGAVALWASLTAAVSYGASVTFAFYSSSAATISTPVISGVVVDSLNPIEQYREYRTLSDSVLGDEEYFLESENQLFEFVERLSKVLSK